MNSMSPKQVWEAALGELQIQVTRANYDTWLKDTVGIGYQGNQFVVGVPNAFCIEWVEKRLHSLITKTLIGIIGNDVDVIFQIYQGQQEVAASSGANPPQNRRNNSVKFNPKYTFDTFIVGNSNRLAHAAALAVAENPGKS